MVAGISEFEEKADDIHMNPEAKNYDSPPLKSETEGEIVSVCRKQCSSEILLGSFEN